MYGDDEIIRSHKVRVDLIGNLILLAFAILLSRLWYLQIYKGEALYNYSIENRLRKEVTKGPRGMFFSRDNKLIVHNVPRFDAVIIPQYLKNKKETIDKLSKILNISVAKINKKLKKNRGQVKYRPVILKKNISRREVAIIETENSKIPGVRVESSISREYVDKDVGGHLLGYISEISQAQLPRYRQRDKFDYKLGDYIGQGGLEEIYDLHLRGADGHQFMEVDARGRMKRHILSDKIFDGIKNKSALPGNNIRLTIDRDLQLTAYKALEGVVGSVVAVDVETGEILSMVSTPSFDPTNFNRGVSQKYWSSLVNDDRNPLRDRTVQEHYAPGSVFKTFTAIAALEEKIIDEKFEVKCTGSFKFGRQFHCWKKYGHGKVKLTKALRESCDVYFYKIATMMDIDVLAKYAKMFGFGVKTGISLPRETTGLIPTKEWKKKRDGIEWQKGETLSCVIGQGFILTTPIQLAMSFSAIASNGIMRRPTIIKEIFSNTGEIIKKNKPEEPLQIQISPKTFSLIKKGLYEVVNTPKGTAWWRRGRGIQMAGKTGTSQVIGLSADKIFNKCEDKEYKYRHHAVFTSYAPYDNPKIAVSVLVEHGCHGSSAAAPVATAVVTAYMKKYQPELYKLNQEKDKAIYQKYVLPGLKKKRELEAKKLLEKKLEEG
jgi:penicillin-binding protein 2